MTSWETCAIEEITVRNWKTKATLFGSTVIPGIYRWEAKVVQSSGSHTILQSEEYQFGSFRKLGLLEREEKLRDAAYQKLIALLSHEGWEAAATDEKGTISLMKRQIKEAKAQYTLEFTDLIQQLASLRDAGILTEQEFQTKKAEILKRM